jgi:glycogen(starch) synthase
MRVLLIGPCPPPHGGISVHVSEIYQNLVASGVTCRVLDSSAGRPGRRFGLSVVRHAFEGWTLHLHTNGHNVKSWLLALGCGLAGQFGGASILTLHSGMAPAYLETAPSWRRRLAALTCSLYTRVICVSTEIRSSLLSLGLDSQRLEVLPAFLGTGNPAPTATTLWGVPPGPRPTPWSASLDEGKAGPGGPARTRASAPLFAGGHHSPPYLLEWLAERRPVFSTVLFFRPEYGFDLLVAGLARLRNLHPSFGCLVMGSGEQRAEAEKRVREAGLEESVLLLGDVDHDTCLALMSVSDVFLRPTLEDGDSISVREALSLGLPVVASRVGTRPSGAILFHTGDVDEMLAKIELALECNGSSLITGTPDADSLAVGPSLDRLMEIYRRVDVSEGSLCLN